VFDVAGVRRTAVDISALSPVPVHPTPRKQRFLPVFPTLKWFKSRPVCTPPPFLCFPPLPLRATAPLFLLDLRTFFRIRKAFIAPDASLPLHVSLTPGAVISSTEQLAGSRIVFSPTTKITGLKPPFTLVPSFPSLSPRV